MMETRGTTLKMNQPRPLEATCKSSDFKPWWGLLTSFFDQDLSHEQFLPGGRYESWNSSTSSPRGSRGRLTTLFVREASSIRCSTSLPRWSTRMTLTTSRMIPLLCCGLDNTSSVATTLKQKGVNFLRIAQINFKMLPNVISWYYV